jgi:hypothetical protein
MDLPLGLLMQVMHAADLRQTKKNARCLLDNGR